MDLQRFLTLSKKKKKKLELGTIGKRKEINLYCQRIGNKTYKYGNGENGTNGSEKTMKI